MRKLDIGDKVWVMRQVGEGTPTKTNGVIERFSTALIKNDKPTIIVKFSEKKGDYYWFNEDEIHLNYITMERNEVYKAIDSERTYQDIRWQGTASSKRRSSENGALDRTLDEFALYIQGYANDLTNISSHTDDPTEKLNYVRKVAGLCVACMEAHGAPVRELPELV